MSVIVIIPARGGSKGIPRKNLRPLAGKPLIYYSIKASLAAKGVDRVVVSTDDDEIALFAERFGADVLIRPKEFADDITTLDPVIAIALKQAEETWQETFDIVVTVQPTSPLVLAIDIEHAINLFVPDKTESVISVVDDRHLCWSNEGGVAAPQYAARVNRQQLPSNFRETGAVIACTRHQLINKGTRIGNEVKLLEIAQDRSFDIDNFSDLALCESLLKRKKIVFTVVGYDAVGLGHVYRSLMIAHELVQFDLHFVCEKSSNLAIDGIRKQHYSVHECEDGSLADTCIKLAPDLVINDILDTDAAYIHALKNSCIKVINFEDIGTGYQEADLVINALYPHQLPSDHVLVGPKYFCLRDEFLYLPERKGNQSVRKILLTFGGVDEGNLTVRALEIIGAYCQDHNISIAVVTGPGYKHDAKLDKCVAEFPELDVVLEKGTRRISDIMAHSDLAITSGGRTVLELSALHIPTIVICQNQRETTHTFASSENGVLNLGFREDVTDDSIYNRFKQVVEEPGLLEIMREKSRKVDFRKGKKRVIKRITDILDN